MPILAATAGSMLTRTTSKLAYYEHGRSLITADLLPKIGAAFVEVFGAELHGTSGKL